MKRYDMKIPRVALGIAAVAMTAFTLGLAIVVPAMSGGDDQVTAANSAAPRTEVAISPSHMEIVGVRERVVASTHVPWRIDFVGARERELSKARNAEVGSK